VETLDQRKAELNRRKEELEEMVANQEWARPTEANLADIRDVIDEATKEGTPAQRKTLFRVLVAGIRVDSKEAIHPAFRRRNPRFDLCLQSGPRWTRTTYLRVKDDFALWLKFDREFFRMEVMVFVSARIRRVGLAKGPKAFLKLSHQLPLVS
jgi:hypothetical protein